MEFRYAPPQFGKIAVNPRQKEPLSALSPKLLDVRVPWVMRHRWAAGQKYQSAGDDGEMYALWVFLEGDARVSIGGRQWHVRAGDVCLWPPQGRREIETPGGASWISLRLRATLWDNVDLLQLLRPPHVWQPDAQSHVLLAQLMENYAHEWAGATSFPFVSPETMDLYLAQRFSTWNKRDTTSLLLCDAYVRAIVALCWRMLSKIDLADAAGANFPPWLGPILARLNAQPDTSIDDLAHEAGISATQLRRQFHKRFGASPREYLNRLRLEDARQLLESSDLSTHEIAERIGYGSVSHFNRAFKTSFGMPPARYRQLLRVSPLDESALAP